MKSIVQGGRILEAFWTPMNRGKGSRLPNHFVYGI
jgi:hypothetical protein